jgi:hypothetical protein
MGPAESDRLDIGTMPRCGMRPIVGLIVYNAALLAGIIKEPSVSVPMAMGANPAETATALPDEDPPGFLNLALAC